MCIGVSRTGFIASSTPASARDASKVAKDNVQQNLSLLRKIALTIIRADKTDMRKSGLRLKRKGAAWDDGARERTLGIRSICYASSETPNHRWIRNPLLPSTFASIQRFLDKDFIVISPRRLLLKSSLALTMGFSSSIFAGTIPIVPDQQYQITFEGSITYKSCWMCSTGNLPDYILNTNVGDSISGFITFGTYVGGKNEGFQIVYSADPIEDSSPYKEGETNPLDNPLNFKWGYELGGQQFFSDSGSMLIQDDYQDRLRWTGAATLNPANILQSWLDVSTIQSSASLITTIDAYSGTYVFNLDATRTVTATFSGQDLNRKSFAFEAAVDPANIKLSLLDDPYTDPDSELRKFFEPKSYSGDLPYGALKIWSGSKYIPLASSEGQELFEYTKNTEVLVHGWNGIGEHNTPLSEKWIAGFTMDLAANKNKDTNILAYDWTEAANSRDGAVKNMVMAELGVSTDDYRLLKNDNECVGNAIACAFILRDRPDLVETREEFRQSFSTWDNRIDDRWVPNEQIDRQGKALAVQLAGLLSRPDSGSVSLFGHSLGAGLATIATEELIDQGFSENVERLTLFDAPVDTNAILVGGVVNIDDNLGRIRHKSPDLAIENYYSLAGGPLGGFGKAYPDAANIGTVRYEHTPVVAELYPETIRYNESPSDYPYSSDRPEGIGYDDLSGDLVRLRTGTDCTLRLFSPFDGLDNCRTNGFRNVEGAAREDFRTILDFDTYLSTENARVEINPETGLPTLITGSPVFAFTDDIFVTEDLVGITIDFEWLTRLDEDDFRIWVNDTLVYTLDGLLARDGLLTTGLIDLSLWHNEAIRLSLGVISDFGDSTLAVRDIRFTRDLSGGEYSTVPTPSTVLMVLTGFALLGRRWASPAKDPCARATRHHTRRRSINTGESIT